MSEFGCPHFYLCVQTVTSTPSHEIFMLLYIVQILFVPLNKRWNFFGEQDTKNDIVFDNIFICLTDLLLFCSSWNVIQTH